MVFVGLLGLIFGFIFQDCRSFIITVSCTPRYSIVMLSGLMLVTSIIKMRFPDKKMQWWDSIMRSFGGVTIITFVVLYVLITDSFLEIFPPSISHSILSLAILISLFILIVWFSIYFKNRNKIKSGRDKFLLVLISIAGLIMLLDGINRNFGIWSPGEIGDEIVLGTLLLAITLPQIIFLKKENPDFPDIVLRIFGVIVVIFVLLILFILIGFII